MKSIINYNKAIYYFIPNKRLHTRLNNVITKLESKESLIETKLSQSISKLDKLTKSSQSNKPYIKGIKTINLKSPYLFRCLASGLVGSLCKTFLNLFCKQTYYQNWESLINLIENRNKETCLITYQNHASTLDDPLLWGYLPTRILFDAEKMRWSLAAKEILFKNWFYNKFFEAGQIIPTIRGDGIYQEAVNAAIDLLDQGKWINIYPEARVNQSDTLLRLKWGLARMLIETKKEPIVVPIYHSGMVGLLPLNEIKLPRINQTLIVRVGQPIYIRQILKKDPNYHQLLKLGDMGLIREYIMKILQNHLEDLKSETLQWMKGKGIQPIFK